MEHFAPHQKPKLINHNDLFGIKSSIIATGVCKQKNSPSRLLVKGELAVTH